MIALETIQEKLGIAEPGVESRGTCWLNPGTLSVRELAQAMMNALGARFITITAYQLPGTEGFRLEYHWDLEGRLLGFPFQIAGSSVESIFDLCEAADWIEREIHEEYAIDFAGREYEPLLLRKDDVIGVNLREEVEKMSYKIPMGPYHPGLEEPYKLDMICEGETVQDAELNIGFNFRGIEHLAETRNYYQVIALMERVCGICSFIHTLTLCQAMEKLTGLEAPPRAQYIRVAMAELERLHSHVLWAGIAAKLMGFKTMFMTCFALREKVMDVLQAISGNRVNYSMNRIGGVNRDIEDPQALLPLLDELEREMMRTVIPIFTTSSTARSRCAGIGVLTHKKAISCAVVGPTARASGVPQDLRRDAPYAAYAEMEFDVPVEQAGDVRARLFVRALEIIESCRILRQALTRMPPGEVSVGGDKFAFITGTATSRVEAPRGEVMYSVSWKEGSRNPARVHVRTPTYANMPAVRWMVRGARLADTPLIQASIDPCYSCTDR